MDHILFTRPPVNGHQVVLKICPYSSVDIHPVAPTPAQAPLPQRWDPGCPSATPAVTVLRGKVFVLAPVLLRTCAGIPQGCRDPGVKPWDHGEKCLSQKK